MQTLGLQAGTQRGSLLAQRRPQATPARARAARRLSLNPCAVASPPQESVLATEAPPVQMGLPYYTKDVSGSGGKTRIVVLGSGWGAMSFVKSFQESMTDRYELLLVSPRNYFVYTPLLPAMCAGTVEERSIVEAVRTVLGNKGKFFEANACEIFPDEKCIVACFPEDAGFPEACFKISYDILVTAVGCINNTFGIEGVEQNAIYFKTVEDAAKLRLRVSECFERAALPQTTPEERKQLLSFVICGGGPTGVEVAAELHDLIKEDLVKLYPNEVKDVKIYLVEMMDKVLGMYDQQISKYTADLFTRNGINLLLNTRVQAVNQASVVVVDKEGVSSEVPFGACVWATGVAMNPLIKELQGRLPPGTQTHFRAIVTDEFLRVKGSKGTIYALGDAATIDQPKAQSKAQQLFEAADSDRNGRVSLREVQAVLNSNSKEFPHLADYAKFMDGKYFNPLAALLANNHCAQAFEGVAGDASLDLEQFTELLKKIDGGLRPLAPTAQVARQEGQYLAELFAENHVRPGGDLPEGARAFVYSHKGSAAYVGADNAVLDIPGFGVFLGTAAGIVWKGFETMSQISFRTLFLVATDWGRAKIFGRDTSRV